MVAGTGGGGRSPGSGPVEAPIMRPVHLQRTRKECVQLGEIPPPASSAAWCRPRLGRRAFRRATAPTGRSPEQAAALRQTCSCATVIAESRDAARSERTTATEPEHASEERRPRPRPPRQGRSRRAARPGRACQQLPRPGAQDVPVDLRPLHARVQPRQRPRADGPSQGPQPRQQPCRRQQLGTALRVLPRQRAPAPDRAARFAHHTPRRRPALDAHADFILPDQSQRVDPPLTPP
jgi:hypothetical protein